MRMHRRVLLPAILYCLLLTTAALAGELRAVRMISLADSFSPWTVTVGLDGSVEYANSSGGFLLVEPAPEKKTGAIPPQQAAALASLIKKAGYPADRSGMAQEPRIKLQIVYADGREITRSGPGDMASAEDKKAFAAIEAEFAKAAKAVGVSGLFLFYGSP